MWLLNCATFSTIDYAVGDWRLWLAVGGIIPLLGGCAVGQYQMPYSDGTAVFVESDHVTHDSPDSYMYDLIAQNASPAYVVAAAPGVVRFIEDNNEEPTKYNNYVWIEHPQYSYECGGEYCTEWTVYAHFAKGSVTGNAGLSVGDTVSAGDFLGFESNVGTADFVHLHWQVAALPPYITPTYNGYYLDYVKDTGLKPELIPIVCHQDGEHVLWRDNTYTAAGCGSARSYRTNVQLGFEQVSGQLQPGSPIQRAIDRISRVSNELVDIAKADPVLLNSTVQLLMKLRSPFEDLRHLGRARVSVTDLEKVRTLLAEYQVRGSTAVYATLEPLRAMLENPAEAEALGLDIWDPFDVLD